MTSSDTFRCFKWIYTGIAAWAALVSVVLLILAEPAGAAGVAVGGIGVVGASLWADMCERRERAAGR